MVEIIQPDKKNVKTYNIDGFEMKTDVDPKELLRTAIAMAQRLMGGRVGIENPFQLEPAAQYVFMASANALHEQDERIKLLEEKIAFLEKELQDLNG